MIWHILRSFDTSDVLAPSSPYRTALIALGHIALGCFVTGFLWALGASLTGAVAFTVGMAALNELRQWRRARRLYRTVPRWPTLKRQLLRDHGRDLAFYCVGIAALLHPPPSLGFAVVFLIGGAGMVYEYWRVWRG